jgi:hypothetical protein
MSFLTASLRSYADQVPTVLSVENLRRTLIDAADELDRLARNPIVQIDPMESECLEIRFLSDPPEVVVLRHGMGYPNDGEAVYSELLDPDI